MMPTCSRYLWQSLVSSDSLYNIEDHTFKTPGVHPVGRERSYAMDGKGESWEDQRRCRLGLSDGSCWGSEACFDRTTRFNVYHFYIGHWLHSAQGSLQK